MVATTFIAMVAANNSEAVGTLSIVMLRNDAETGEAIRFAP
jgi:hypothetical protein